MERKIQMFIFALIFFVITMVCIVQKESISLLGVEISSLAVREKPIVIGVVICSKNGDTASREETLTLIKSVVISAILYHYPRITFHLFLEHEEDEGFFQKLNFEMNNSTQEVHINFIYHSALDLAPKKFEEQMVFHKRFRCGFVRIFFPDAMPDVDSILYLDTDSIVTGNIGTLWNYLGKMKNDQMLGMVMANAAHNPHYKPTFRKSFGAIPHPTSKGLVSGLMLMNLTRMREYKAVDKMIRLYQDYSKHYTLEDQKLINIFLYYAEGLLQLLPCQYNFRDTYCEFDLYCEEALEDYYGLHLVHGTAGQFERGKTFNQLYQLYHNVSIADGQNDSFKSLMQSVRNAYGTDSKRTGRNKKSKCYSILSQILYRNFQTDLLSQTN